MLRTLSCSRFNASRALSRWLIASCRAAFTSSLEERAMFLASESSLRDCSSATRSSFTLSINRSTLLFEKSPILTPYDEISAP